MNNTYRILDANLNRSREALRVIEEYFRFIRDDAALTGRIKRLRHRIKEIVDVLGAEKLLSARATDSDVGRVLPSPSRSEKSDPKVVVVASCKRIQEAMRSIEEYGHVVDPDVPDLAASLRFDAYALEKTILLAVDPVAAFQRVRLYVLIGSDLCNVDRIVPLSRDLLDAGADCLQLREKQLTDKETFDLAEKLTELCRARGKLFIVNDRPDVARAVSADGVHLGQDDLSVPAARAILPDAIVGVSTHNIDQVACAIDDKPTYTAVGPAFETQTKPHEPPAGIDFLRPAVERLNQAGIAHVAIGGINANNLDEILAVGVRRIAVSSAILRADDPTGATAVLAQRLAQANA